MAFAVIAAGGSGDRLGVGVAKFEAEILGRPMVSYSLETFQSSSAIDDIILVVPADRLADWSPRSLSQSGISKASLTVAGGRTRQESVFLAIQLIEGEEGVVAVHDAARPLVTRRMVDAVCEIPEGFDGLITAVPVTDTIKSIEGGAVASTLERSQLVSVQTPQAFDLATLIHAHRAASRDGFTGTDDSSLVEREGGRVGIVEGRPSNIKVTYQADLVMAAAVLSGRGMR
ncbi:MAG TPA: 2-C-methyl-D-erythritol 4-phosphate cytidylyltransferase [Candidatus Anoxymicrobiaceae bacterium]|jgi:2-C-methyl-D-erythritol 4-phosphate cytidylyltransferase